MKDYFFSLTGLIATVLAYCLSFIFEIENMSIWAWLIIILGVDVSHVYSTLYRTYFNPIQRQQMGLLLILVPFVAFFSALILAYSNTSLFWTVLAYVAIFHFSRQQIGFLRWLGVPRGRGQFVLEIGIYISTLGSILLWHLQGPKNFNWFVAQDLLYLDQIPPWLQPSILFWGKIMIVGYFVLSLIVSLYLLFKKRVSVHIPLVLTSTFASWYFPIVVFNSDFIFSMANVLAHGLPYMALVWTEESRTRSPFRQLELFFGLVLILALFEEAFWDALVWREQTELFESFYFLPEAKNSTIGLALVLAVLILPQLTHYILDGFIWKKKYRQPVD